MKIEGLKDAEEWTGGGILGPGYHEVKIAKAMEGESSGGHPQIELEFDGVGNPGSIRDWLVITPNTVGKLKQLTTAAGITIDSDEFDATKLLGQRLSIFVAEEPDRQDADQDAVAGQGIPAARRGQRRRWNGKSDADLPF